MKKLYYSLPYIKEFEAVVLSCVQGKGGRFEIELDQTGFYPEGGGQPSDTGLLDEVRVTEVHEKGEKLIHYTESAIEPGRRVRGHIDWEVRFSNMQEHTGEHILSGIIHRHFGYDNVGFHMGSEEVTIDFNGLLSQEQLAAAESEANQMIYANLPVRITYPSEEELQKLNYRSKKELNGQVRIVEIPGADVCACCGTHVERTGEVGLIKCIGMIHYKGGVRISILCGTAALRDYCRKQLQITRISNLLSAKPELAAAAVEKVRNESVIKDGQISQLYQKLFQIKLNQFEKSTQPLVIFEEELSPALIRQYCTLLYEQEKGSVVMVCSGTEGCYQYAMGSRTKDMQALSKLLNASLKGRGGGSRLMVQGTYQADRKVIEDTMGEIGRKAEEDGIK